MPEFYGKRIGNVLTPDGDEEHAEFEHVPRGKLLRIDVTQPRNVKHHRLYFKLCQRIGQGIGQTTDWVDRAFRIETGHVDVYEYGGREHFVLRSIAFHKLDQIAFSELFERCVQIAYGKWNVPPESINDLLLQGKEDQRRR